MQNLAPLLLTAALLLSGCAGNPASQSSSATESTPSSEPASTATENRSTASETTVPDALTDTIIVPGERVGPVTQETSRESLAQLFGDAALTDEDVHVGEGFTEPGTKVNLGAERSFTVVWADKGQTKPAEVRNLGSAWQTPQGIGVGTPFSELQQKLGDFRVYGFGWDYGGTVDLSGSNLADYNGLLVMRLEPDANAAKNDSDSFAGVSGDSLFPSSDPHFQDLNLQVGTIIVYLSPREE